MNQSIRHKTFLPSSPNQVIKALNCADYLGKYKDSQAHVIAECHFRYILTYHFQKQFPVNNFDLIFPLKIKSNFK